jgi:acyl-CoA reductase-like NAD-dependent aldehyde dehydrogenase
MASTALAQAFPKAGEIPERWRHAPSGVGLRLITGGELKPWQGASQEIRSAVCVRDERDGLLQLGLGPAAQASSAEGLAALESAVAAWQGGRGEWPRASVEDRIAAIQAFAAKAKPQREPVAKALMWEVGKPYADCLVEFDRTLDYIDATIETLRQLERDNAPHVKASGFAARVRRAPLGVALCMGPYNYAVNEVFTTVIPALIMGNPVIMKTPRYGVLSNALLAPALVESFPKGVVSLVTGQGPVVVGPMMESGKVDVLALIGSSRTAKALLRQHPRFYRLRTVLGMGAKNPAIVLKDAELDEAAKEIVSGALTFNGQRCTALKHVLVERPVADALVERLAQRIDALKLGMPWEDGVTISPMPDPDHPAHMEELVTDAVAKGARVVNQGGGERAGTLYRPALVSPVPRHARLFREEQFGPVVPVSVLDSAEDALAIVAESDVGQQASIFGKDKPTLARLVDHLANLTCRVNLNTQCRRGPDVLPFTGRKDSAVATLSVYDALRSFSIRSVVAATEKGEPLLQELGAQSVFLAPPAR